MRLERRRPACNAVASAASNLSALESGQSTFVLRTHAGGTHCVPVASAVSQGPEEWVLADRYSVPAVPISLDTEDATVNLTFQHTLFKTIFNGQINSRDSCRRNGSGAVRNHD